LFSNHPLKGWVTSTEELAALEGELAVQIFSETYPAKMIRGCLYDSKGNALKARMPFFLTADRIG
jgi:hypothetical protein